MFLPPILHRAAAVLVVAGKIDPADDSVVWADAELDELIDDYVAAARVAVMVVFAAVVTVVDVGIVVAVTT